MHFINWISGLINDFFQEMDGEPLSGYSECLQLQIAGTGFDPS